MTEQYRNIICPSCGGKIWEHGNSSFHCQRLRRNVCAACCRSCPFNREWTCAWGMQRKARRLDHKAKAESILKRLLESRQQKSPPGESDGPRCTSEANT